MLRCAILAQFAFACFLGCVCAPAHAQWEIRVWHAMSGAQATELEDLAQRFNAQQKEFRVVLTYKGSPEETLAATLATQRRGLRALLPHAAPPHVVQIQETGSAEMLSRRGLTVPLWQILQDAGERIEGYLPPVEAPFSDAQGRLLALPFNAATPVLYYNRDALRNAKLVPPRTWEEMPAVLDALAKEGYGCAYTTAYPSWVLLENMSAWHDQRFATRHNGMSGGEARLAFNSRLMVRWISTLSTWRQSGYFMYWGRGDEAETRFALGHCALLTSSSASYAALRGRAGFDLGVAQLPYYSDFDDAPQNTLAASAALGPRRQAAYRVCRRGALLRVPRAARRAGGLDAEDRRDSADLRRLRADAQAGLLRGESGPGSRSAAGARQAADRRFARHPPRPVPAHPRHHQRGARAGLGRAQVGSGCAQRGGGARQRGARRPGEGRRRAMSPRLLRWGMNLWPPFRGAGIRVTHIADDWTEARVELRQGLLNRNFVGTHYGGSLFSMTDPFYALMLMHRLGERYLVWDQAASIDFVAPGRGRVSARFLLAPERIKEIESLAATGDKVLPQFDAEVKDEAGALVARVRKTLYVRLKPRYRPR